MSQSLAIVGHCDRGPWPLALSPSVGIVERVIVVAGRVVAVGVAPGRGAVVVRVVGGPGGPPVLAGRGALGCPPFGSPVALATIGRVDGFTCQRNVPDAPTS